MLVKWILEKWDNQELAESWLQFSVIEDKVSSMILDFMDKAVGKVEIVVSKWIITVRQLE